MKSIVCVNYEIPTVDNQISYLSNDSLRDYDIAVFDPVFPYLSRVEFSAGGSCLAIESTTRLNTALAHWLAELQGALKSGKTIFILLNTFVQDMAAVSSSLTSKNNRTYSTRNIENYSAIPEKITPKNAQGRKIHVKDGRFRNLYEIISKMTEYRVILPATSDMKVTFSAKDGAPVGAIIKPKGLDGSLILLPYFSFGHEGFTEEQDGDTVWTKEAIQTSHALVSQILAIDKTMRSEADLTPSPNWIDDVKSPMVVVKIDAAIGDIDSQIEQLQKERKESEQAKSDLLAYTHLLYETGKPLERAIEKTLKLLGYEVASLHIGDLEIDHVMVSPNEKRMIGEAEGKDTSAIDISKFRQLASNIQEDLARDEVSAPAKGILFGNGYRLMPPENRPEQFTQKSLTNAQLYGTALIRTSDLYPIAVYLLDHPEDDDYRTICRAAIEDTAGSIVSFPSPT